MDWEAPADAWYVWVAVTIVSLAIGGIALGLPTAPPPDAGTAADTIDGVTGSQYATGGSYEHDGDRVKIDGATIALQNDGGTDRATLLYGSVVPVQGNESLMNLTRGASLEEEYGGEGSAAVERLLDDADDAYTANTGEWKTATGELTVRTIRVDAYWYRQWSAEQPEREYVKAEVTEENDGNVPQQVRFEYRIPEETEITFHTTSGSETWNANTWERTVQGTDEITFDLSSTHAYYIHGKIEMNGEVYYEEIHSDDDTVTVYYEEAELGPEAVAPNFDWLNYDSDSDEFYVTLVFA